MELAWKAGLMDFAMPYMIQITRDMFTKIDTVQKKNLDREKKEEQAAKQQISQPMDMIPGMMSDTPMLMNAPENTGFGGFSTMGSGLGMGSGMGMGMGSTMSSMSGTGPKTDSSGFGQFSSWR